jgi:hypothetical protein
VKEWESGESGEMVGRVGCEWGEWECVESGRVRERVGRVSVSVLCVLRKVVVGWEEYLE